MHLSLAYKTLFRSPPRALANLAASLAVFGVVFANVAVGAESPVKASPAPELLPAEKNQRDRLHAALAPLLSISPSEDDAQALREVASTIHLRGCERLHHREG